MATPGLPGVSMRSLNTSGRPRRFAYAICELMRPSQPRRCNDCPNALLSQNSAFDSLVALTISIRGERSGNCWVLLEAVELFAVKAWSDQCGCPRLRLDVMGIP